MLHNYITDDDSGRHYGISSNETYVLLQIDDGVNQVRSKLSPQAALIKAAVMEEFLFDGNLVIVEAKEGQKHLSLPLTTEQCIHVIRLLREHALKVKGIV